MSFRSRLGVGILLIVSFLVIFGLEKSMTVKASPESQSIFFKQYNPEKVIERFSTSSAPAALPRKVESSGSWGFAAHRLTLTPEITVEPARREELISALEHDAVDCIKQHGGTIVREEPQPPLGFQVGYQLGPTRGAVVVKPASGQDSAAPKLKLEIKVQEMWSAAVAHRKKN